jgi:hypothetical protein
VQRSAPIAKEIIFVAAGAEWISTLVEAHLAQAVQIIDWFHAVEHPTPVTEQVKGSAAERTTWLAQPRTAI